MSSSAIWRPRAATDGAALQPSHRVMRRTVHASGNTSATAAHPAVPAVLPPGELTGPTAVLTHHALFRVPHTKEGRRVAGSRCVGAYLQLAWNRTRSRGKGEAFKLQPM